MMTCLLLLSITVVVLVLLLSTVRATEDVGNSADDALESRERRGRDTGAIIGQITDIKQFGRSMLSPKPYPIKFGYCVDVIGFAFTPRMKLLTSQFSSVGFPVTYINSTFLQACLFVNQTELVPIMKGNPPTYDLFYQLNFPFDPNIYMVTILVDAYTLVGVGDSVTYGEAVSYQYMHAGAPLINYLNLAAPLPPLQNGLRRDPDPKRLEKPVYYLGGTSDDEALFEDIPRPNGNVMQQLEENLVINKFPELVDLIYLGGCASDIRVSSVPMINWVTLSGWISVACRTRIQTVLLRARQLYPNAAIIVHGYQYPLADSTHMFAFANSSVFSKFTPREMLNLLKKLIPTPFATDNLPMSNTHDLVAAIAKRAAQAVNFIHTEQLIAINWLKNKVKDVYHVVPPQWLDFRYSAYGTLSRTWDIEKSPNGTFSSDFAARQFRLLNCDSFPYAGNGTECLNAGAFHRAFSLSMELNATVAPILAHLFPLKAGIQNNINCPNKVFPRSPRTYT